MVREVVLKMIGKARDNVYAEKTISEISWIYILIPAPGYGGLGRSPELELTYIYKQMILFIQSEDKRSLGKIKDP